MTKKETLRMKLLTLALVMIPTYSLADTCDQVGRMAESTMRARQTGVPTSEMMRIATNQFKGYPAARELARDMILDAYSKPRFYSDSMQYRAVQDFRNYYETICYSTKN